MKLTAVVSALLLLFTVSSSPAAELPVVPEGYSIEVVAEHPLVNYPMMAGFDDRGRLFIAENAGVNLPAKELLEDPPNFIRMLEDTDGDGTFDNSTIFADKLTFPQGALWHRGALYVASPPYIWRFEDTDDDGVADVRTPIVGEFGFTGNAASIHGCFLGPDGRIYWCDGRHGHEFTNDAGDITSKGLAARIFSCKPDGSDVQIFCGGGMDNPVEIDFMPTGEMLGTVNILLNGPRVDCLMHWIEGGNYPHYQKAYSEMPRTGELLQPMTRFGHVAVSGMTRYSSTGQYEALQNSIFTTIFNLHKVVRSDIKRVGATFETIEEDFLVSDNPDFHPTDILEDADGSLLVIDTGGWFRIGCPNSQIAKPEFTGAIYRIRKTDTAVVMDPRGLELDWDTQNVSQLIELLGDSRPAVSERAIDQLALTGDEAVAELTTAINTADSPASLPAVWALRRMETDKALTALREELDSKNLDVRRIAIRSVGELNDLMSLNLLLPNLRSEDLSLKQTAATSIGRILEKHADQIPTVIQERVLNELFVQLQNPEIDRVTEHSLIFAVIRFNRSKPVIPFLAHDNPLVRRGALIVLDQMGQGELTREQVVPLLNTSDPQLQNEVLHVISEHEGWASETLALLDEWMQDSMLTEEQVSVLRGFLLAQISDEAVQSFIARNFATTSEPNQLLLLDVISASALPALPNEWDSILLRSLADEQLEIRLAAVRALNKFDARTFEKQLKTIVADEGEAANVRVEATHVLANLLTTTSDPLFKFVLSQLAEDNFPTERLAAARALAALPLSIDQQSLLVDQLTYAGPVARPVLIRSFADADQEELGLKLVKTLEELKENLPAEQLDLLFRNYPESVQQLVRQKLVKTEADFAENKAMLAELEPLLSGGDPSHGQTVFFGKKAACSGCHAVHGKGARIGPDLSQIGAIRTERDLLEAIVLPSASFAREFNSYTVITEDGKVHSGIISRETPEAIFLRKADLSEVRIPQEEIDEMQESKISIMPKDLHKAISDEELRDLIAYLEAQTKLGQ
ncbi:HEAT repeat protein [Polystyrenella longa]|uniref:HEAT repeat protein n=1 Tax=Polystyrenella longa TaxID=2528007 RepID=A0A518CHN0_9PLAN|nr:PVC-type heme-binding CxxCH protein [Polystyrenella longa]QDU78736.1 HEAT repeat protein [Polystyrenella longa]